MTVDKNYLPPELAAQLLEREAAHQPLAPDADEMLTLLVEECAETIQRCTKIKRFGMTVNPWNGKHNRDELELEVGDVLAAVRAMSALGIIDIERCLECADRKLEALRRPDGRLRHAKIPEGA